LAGGLNTVISLFYYVKVLKVMILEKTLEEVEDRPVEQKPIPILQSAYVTMLALAVTLLIIPPLWNPITMASSKQGVDTFRAAPKSNADWLPVKKGP